MNELFTLCAKRLTVKEKGADRRVLRAGWVRQSVVLDLVLQTGRNQQGHSKIPFLLSNCPERHDRKGGRKATARHISVPRTALQLGWIPCETSECLQCFS